MDGREIGTGMGREIEIASVTKTTVGFSEC